MAMQITHPDDCMTTIRIPVSNWGAIYIPRDRDCWQRYREMTDWLDDEARPGYWYGDSGRDGISFFCSNPRVALEFKLRFG